MEKDQPKKRGRKPKGGTFIESVQLKPDDVEPSQNIILHLKCSLHEIHSPTNVSSVAP